MAHLRAALAVALLALPLVSASIIEDETGGAVTYQFDAGTFTDAPDTCEEASATWSVPVGGHTHGMVVPVEDELDFITFSVPADGVGDRFSVTLLSPDVEVELFANVHVPACGGTIFDPENQPSESNPPPPGPGESAVEPHNLDSGGWTCNPAQWKFLINKLDGYPAPASIYVEWTNGESENVPLLHVTPAKTAHYVTSSNLDTTLSRVVANVATGWPGNFNVGAGPCDAEDGDAVFGDPPTRVGNQMEFTPIESGLFIVEIRFVPPQVPENEAVPASCHNCFPGLTTPEPTKYDLEVDSIF